MPYVKVEVYLPMPENADKDDIESLVLSLGVAGYTTDLAVAQNTYKFWAEHVAYKVVKSLPLEAYK